MKKSFYAALALSAIIVSSIMPGCKKDDGNSSPTIVGEWEARETHVLVTTLSTPPLTLYKEDTTYAAGQGDYLNLRTDNKYVAKDSYTSTKVTDSGIAVLGHIFIVG